MAKKFDYDYWDGDRQICYGGYRYLEGRWEKVARAISEHYKLPENPKILDIGCGKGYLLFDILKVIPGAKICGIDISEYAIAHSKPEISGHLRIGSATDLPWPDKTFDLVISINTLHCLHAYDLEKALSEMERVGKKHKYLCVESYRTEKRRRIFSTGRSPARPSTQPDEWLWWFKQTGLFRRSFLYILRVTPWPCNPQKRKQPSLLLSTSR